MIMTNRTRGRAHALLATLLTLPASILAHQPRPYGDGDDDDKDNKGANLQALIARLGTADAAANELWRDNYQLREQRRTLRDENKALAAKLPAEGTVVLTKEQAADWEAYVKLGKPADVEKGITDGKTAAEAVAKRDRSDTLAKVATDMGYNPEVFTQLADLHKLTVTSQTVKVGDKDQSVHTVTPEGGQPMELTQYAAAHWAPFAPSLQQAGGGQGGQGQGQGGNGGQGQGGQGQGGGQGQAWVGTGGTGGQGSGGGGGVDAAKLAQDLLKNRADQGGTNALQRQANPNGPQQPGTGQQSGHVPGGPGGGAGGGQQ